ncbi:MAG: heat-inducible transcription repressor HrcA, partial [Oscillospiraceae bacterium]|nr:heat-inducible transcription repressor HrcA [Oscillospiraceae bacterium]
NVVFGKENDTFAIGNSSLIVSKYGNEEPFGSFGVIGPIRLDYQKIIPYVSYFSKSVTTIINNMLNEIKEGEFDDERKADNE